MGIAHIMGFGGNGVYSEDLTAKKDTVLAGSTYVGNDTNDEAGTGTMPDKRNTNAAFSSMTRNGSNISIKVPYGYYDSTSNILIPSGNFGNAVKTQVLEGKTFTSTDTSATVPSTVVMTGTMKNKSSGFSASSPSATVNGSLTKSGNNVVFNLPDGSDGFYNKNSIIAVPLSKFGNATAAQVRKGNTFTSSAGVAVAGTADTITARTITPSTADVTLSAGSYLDGNVVVKGDPNFLAKYIAKNITIFGIKGSYEGYYVDPNTGLYTNGSVRSGSSLRGIDSDNKTILTKDYITHDSGTASAYFEITNINFYGYTYIIIEGEGFSTRNSTSGWIVSDTSILNTSGFAISTNRLATDTKWVSAITSEAKNAGVINPQFKVDSPYTTGYSMKIYKIYLANSY
ncbi:MAG: hypothetical protein MJZ16_13775 [Bacteroidales bacterium]|nr:hypothetical protein [Bacteroidales bacterium]